MKNRILELSLVALFALTACTPRLQAPAVASDPSPENDPIETPTELKEGDIVFDIHSADYGCGVQSDPIFGCLKVACQQARGAWDQAGQQCLCEDGMIFVQGPRSECQRSHAGEFYAHTRPVVIQGSHLDNETATPLELNHTPQISRLGHTQVFIAPSYETLPYRSPESFASIKYRNGFEPNRPQDGPVSFNFVTYVVERPEDLEEAMIRREFNARTRAIAPKRTSAFDSTALAAALFELNTLPELPDPQVRFSAREGGCAAGCRLAFPLVASNGYTAYLVRDYMWGSIGMEYVEITDSNDGRIEAVLLPSGAVSHLRTNTIIELHTRASTPQVRHEH